MSLSTSLSTALSSLATTAEQTSVISRNVANTNNPAASRQSAPPVPLPGSAARPAPLTPRADPALYHHLPRPPPRAPAPASLAAASATPLRAMRLSPDAGTSYSWQ